MASASVVLTSDTSGSVTVTVPSGTSIGTTTLTLPTTGGTIQTSGSGYTTNGVAYASSTSALTTGSSLVWTGSALGIGTTSPASKLEVSGTGTIVTLTGTGVTNYFKMTNTGQTSANGFQMQTVNEDIYFLNYSTAGNIIFGTNGSSNNDMTIDASGNLLVGQTSSTDGGGICVSKSVNGATMANFYNTYGSGAQTLRTSMVAGANNTSSYHYVASSGGDKLYIYGNGNVVNSNNSYGTLSDAKLKENIVDASSKLADVMQLKVRNFNLKTEPDHKQIGFIAQEFEQVFPALIDNTASPNDPNDIIKSIKTSVLVPILVKSIQELSALITAQSATITSLTERITALENK
jgi:hypothetical protein